jgi:hypothetical protein
MLVRAAFLAGRQLPTSAISVIRTQASESEMGSCTLMPTSMLARRRSRNHAPTMPMMPPARIKRMACETMRRNTALRSLRKRSIAQ